jgi:GNAT superfamily N-acetyltransferase
LVAHSDSDHDSELIRRPYKLLYHPPSAPAICLCSFLGPLPRLLFSPFRSFSNMPNPALEVSLLKPEEAQQYMRIRHEVFRPTVNKVLYSRGEPSQKTLDRVTEEIRDGVVNKGILYLKCVDKSTGEMVAGARWRYVKPREEGTTETTTSEKTNESASRKEPYDESDPPLFYALDDLFTHHKNDILESRPYYALDTLVTLPQHERRGAGSMLVRWGCEKADDAGVEAYLEASPMGAPMYARHGFEEVRPIELDLRKYGGDEALEFIVSTFDECIEDFKLTHW